MKKLSEDIWIWGFNCDMSDGVKREGFGEGGKEGYLRKGFMGEGEDFRKLAGGGFKGLG